MIWIRILLGLMLFLAAATLLIAYICYRMAFYAPPRKVQDPEFISIPQGEIYEPFREKMENWTRQTRKMPHEDMEIVSFDGLFLRGKYYEYTPDAPIELMFHGYRGDSERDLSGGVQRCFKLGHSALLVDQRCCGASEGRTITFGIREHRDCLAWLAFMEKRFGPERKILLTGISMGASTVLMAAGKTLPKQVVGVLADCGYSSPKEIIKVVIKQMGLPTELAYPFVKLGARLYGGFDLEEDSPVEAVKRSKLPVIFFHGEQDDFVPCYMSRENYEACASRKQLVTVPGAGHGLSYPVAPERYLQAVADFFRDI